MDTTPPAMQSVKNGSLNGLFGGPAISALCPALQPVALQVVTAPVHATEQRPWRAVVTLVAFAQLPKQEFA
jgi:hypothetical protein